VNNRHALDALRYVVGPEQNCLTFEKLVKAIAACKPIPKVVEIHDVTCPFCGVAIRYDIVSCFHYCKDCQIEIPHEWVVRQELREARDAECK